jgi:division protein CdvB (Snf7/Vps24/ESCRT-III family)
VLAPTRFPKFKKAAEAEQQRLRLENSRLRVQLARSQAEVRQLIRQLSGQQH